MPVIKNIELKNGENIKKVKTYKHDHNIKELSVKQAPGALIALLIGLVVAMLLFFQFVLPHMARSEVELQNQLEEQDKEELRWLR